MNVTLAPDRAADTAWFEPLPPARIAADAAQTYLPEVVRTLAVRPDLGRIKSLDWHTESESLPHESADGLLQRVHESDAEELVASALAPASRVTATPKVRLKDGRTLNLAAATTTFAQLRELVAATHGVANALLKYVDDDGDHITIGNDADVQVRGV